MALRDAPKLLLRLQKPTLLVPSQTPAPSSSQGPAKAELEVGLGDLHPISHRQTPILQKGMQACPRSQRRSEVGQGLDPRKIYPTLWRETGEQWWASQNFSRKPWSLYNTHTGL